MIEDILRETFGYTSFRPLQTKAIEAALNKRDSVVIMPTGGGKSLCYQIPALAQDGLAIVISPLIALMKDQVDALKGYGVVAAFWNSTLTGDELSALMEALHGGVVKLLYVSPERFNREGFLDFISELPVSLFAIDEAHCISDWGHDFRPEYRGLQVIKERFPEIPCMALTATATGKVSDDICNTLKLKDPERILGSFDRKNLYYEIRKKEETYEQILHYLQSEDRGAGIIYCLSRKKVEELSTKLQEDGFSALPYHAGLPIKVRSENHDKFLRDGVQIIVATIAFGMGIDKPNIRFVIHHSLPKNIESYYQETGRAGRDGLPSECILFYSFADRIILQSFIDKIADSKEREHSKTKLDDLVKFVSQRRCRRIALLGYFGEEYPSKTCPSCDICTKKEVGKVDATEISYKILSAIIRLEENCGTLMLVDVLRGAKTKKVYSRGAEKLSVYGIAAEQSPHYIKSLVEELLHYNYAYLEEDSFPILKVSEKGRQALFKREKIFLSTTPKKTPTKEIQRKKEMDYNEDLFLVLKSKRSALAAKENVPPYVIFSDRSLQEMAYYIPQTKEQFLSISGVGDYKVRKYGLAFLGIILKFAEENSLESIEKEASSKPVKAKRKRGRGASSRYKSPVKPWWEGNGNN
ncbi:MAG: ATP-dependent DNA helicase RecQ [Chlamydiales bacterium]|jgi:ATP-dependent DNA helicase RecQ